MLCFLLSIYHFFTQPRGPSHLSSIIIIINGGGAFGDIWRELSWWVGGKAGKAGGDDVVVNNIKTEIFAFNKDNFTETDTAEGK